MSDENFCQDLWGSLKSQNSSGAASKHLFHAIHAALHTYRLQPTSRLECGRKAMTPAAFLSSHSTTFQADTMSTAEDMCLAPNASHVLWPWCMASANTGVLLKHYHRQRMLQEKLAFMLSNQDASSVQ